MTIGINTITGEQSEVIKTDHNERGKTGDLGIDVDQSVDQIAKEGASTQDASSAYPNMYAFADLNRMRELSHSEEFDIDPETVSMAAQNFAIGYLSEEDLTRLNDLYENPFLSKEAEIYTRVNALTHEIFSGKDGEILPERYSVAVMTNLLTWNTILDSMKSHKELSEEDYQLLSRVQIGITRAISQALYEIGPKKAKVLTVILHLEIPQIEDLWGIEVNYAGYEKK